MTQNHGAAMTTLTTGSIVRLKSGGPAMTVESVDSDQRGGPGLEAACLWISESGCFGRLRIAVGLLDVVSPSAAPSPCGWWATGEHVWVCACGKLENEIVESAKRAAGAVNHTLHDTACRVAHAFTASPLTSADACLRCGRRRANHTT